MKRTFPCWSILVCLLLACNNNISEKQEITKLIKKWSGKEIIFPSQPIFSQNGKEVPNYKIPAADFK